MRSRSCGNRSPIFRCNTRTSGTSVKAEVGLALRQVGDQRLARCGADGGGLCLLVGIIEPHPKPGAMLERYYRCRRHLVGQEGHRRGVDGILTLDILVGEPPYLRPA